MAHRSQCSTGDNPLDPNYLPPHYREEYRMAIDALVEADLEGYYRFLHEVDVVDFLSRSEIEYIRCKVQVPRQTTHLERRCMAEDVDGSSDTYWPVHSDHDAPNLDLGWPQQCRFVGPTEVTTLVNPSDPEMPSIKEQVRRMIKTAQQVIAVVMDMFTDVDIFADILGAATRGVAVYVLLDELNAQHFVGMVNNCRVNLDEIKFMRVRTVSGSTYSCRTGKTFKGQMMERFILVDCRAVLSGNYSFMWSFEKIHRCLAHLFLGQLVTTFDEEFRILFAHSEPLVVENVLANMPDYGGEPEGYYNTENTHMFNRQYPTMGMEWAERTGQDHIKVGQIMLPLRSESIHSAAEANPSVQRHMNLHDDQPYRGDHQSIEHGMQMRGPNEMVGFKRHSYGNIPDYEYLPPKNHPTMRGNQYMEAAVPQSGYLAREPHIYQGAGLQSGYDMYGKFRGQGHIDQFTGSGYPHEGDEAEPPGTYDHVQRYLQSQCAMEEGHGPRNLLSPVQSNIKRHSMSQSYTCQSSPKQPNLPEQKLFFNVNHKPQDMSQKQGLRNWRISSYLSAYDDAGELDLAELEGSTTCGDVPCFTQEAPCGPVRAEIRSGNREFNRIPSPRENPMFVQLQKDYIVPDSSVNHPTDLSQINIKTTSTSESSCTTEGDKVEETQNREPKETNRISEEFLRRKPSRPFQRGSRLRHSVIFSSNLELHTSDEMKDTAEEKDGDEASKPRGTHILDKRRTGSPFQPFQWSNFVKSNTFDNSTTESPQPEHELNKKGDNSHLDKVENSQNLQKKVPLQENDQPQPAVPEIKSQRDECPSNLLQKTSFMDMDDPDCRLRYFKELAAKRKLAAAKVPQSNPVKATQKFALPEKPCTNDADKNAGPVLKTSEITLKSKNTTIPAQEIKETCKDTKCEESREDVLHRATDAEKIRFKKKLAEESGSTSSFFQKDIDPTLKPVKEARTLSTAKNQTSPILKKCAQKPSYALSGESSDPCASSSSEPCSKKPLSTASATLEAKNRVESVAFNTPSTESGLIQFRGSKETDPSHAVLTESCPPVKLPKTKCMSPLSTTQNEGCLFAKDSQTIAQSSSNISSTCSDTVSLDLNSKPNLAIVDTCVPSKPDHIDTVPSPSSTTGISSAADSFHLLSETVEDFSRHFITVGSEQSAAKSACSQNPSAPEEKPSQQHALIEADSSEQPTTTESKPSQNTSTEADSSQHPPALETHCLQQLTALREESSLHSTSTESETSQNLPIKNVAEAFQQPTAVESKSSHHSTANATTSSQQPTETEEDSQLLAKTQDSTVAKSEISKQLPVMETHPATNEPSQQCTATSSDSSNHPPAMRANLSQHTSAAEMDSSQQSTASVVDSSQQLTAKECELYPKPTATSAEPFKQITPSATDTSQQSTASVVDTDQKLTVSGADTPQNNTSIKCELSPEPFRQPHVVGAGSSQQPTATVPYSSQQPTLTITDSSQQPTVTVPDSSQQPTLTITDSTQPTVTASTQQPTVTVPDSTQQPAVTVPDSTQQPNATVTDSTQQPNATVPDSTQQPNTTVTDSTQQPNATVTNSTPQPTVTVTDSTQQPTVTVPDSTQQPTVTVTDSTQQPNATVTDSIHEPNATVTDSTQQPNATVPDSTQQPNATVPDSTQQPTVTVTDSTQQPTVTVTDSTQQPTVTVTDSTQQPNATVTDSTQQPTVTFTDSTQQPTVTVTDSTQQPTVTVTDSTQQPTVTVPDSTQQPTVTVTDSTQQPTVTVTDSTQQPTVTVTDSTQQPTVTVSDSTQQPNATVTDSTQQPTVTETDASQQTNATVTDSTQQPTVTVTDSTQQPTVTVTDSTQQPTVTVTDSTQQPTVTVTDSTQQPTVTVTDSTQQPTVTVTDSTQQPTVTVTDSTQQPTVTVTDSTQQPTVTVTDSTQQPNATVTDSTQQPNATVTDSTQQPTLTIIDSTQQPNATVTDSTQQPNATVTDSTQQPTVTVTDSTQQTTVTATDSTQQPNATVTDSTQQPNATVTDSTQQPNATVTDSTQQPTVTVTDSTQQPTVTVTDSTQQPTVTVTDSTQQPTVTVTDSTQQTTVTATDSTQQPNATVTDSTQQPNATVTDSTQQPNATVTDSTQQPTVTVTDSTQQPTVTVTDSTQQTTVTVTDSTQQPNATVTDSTQQPNATVTDSTQQPNATVTDSTQQPTVTVTDSTQQPTVTVKDSTQQPNATVTDSTQQPTLTIIDSTQQPTATETDASQQPARKDTDFFHQSIAKETELSQQLTVTESESPQKSTEMMVDTSKHLIETKNESLQHITATESDCLNEKKKKDDKLSEGFSKPIPTDITQADNSISQITELSSTTEHSQSDTVPPCDSQTQAQTKPCTIHMVKDTDNDDSTQPQVSPELSLSSTQEITQLQSSISSNPTESRPNDPKPEKTDGCQKNETITEQSQRHDTEITQTEVSTALDPKQTTPEVENSVTNFAEVSEKSNLTVHSNLQSSVEKNPKSVISAHQLSTANVISCSNLRDDTKVLLGQISAKNQSRSSQSKQTPAAPSEAKESVVSSADKLLSKHSGRPWSSKATPEERDMIIQKMEKMRKERRVYSRFDTS